MGKTYTASVVVNPCYPYQFDETTTVTVNGKKVSASLNEYGKLTVSNAVSFTAKEATLVTAAEITLFDTLYEGRAMNDSTNWIWSEEKGYSTLIFWENNEDERSIAGKEYTAALKVYPASGCKFDETTAVKVNGKEVTASLNEDGTLSIAETFTITAKKGELVTEAKLTIAKPVAGTELDIWGSCEDETSYYSFVSWSPKPEDGIAVAGTDYTATVRVTSIYGHSFDKTTKVTVNGKKVNASLNEYGQLVFTYVFAADSSYTGLKYVNGSWCYFVKGVTDESYSNLVNYNKGWYYVHNGKIDWNYSTLAQVDGKGAWYCVKNGKIDWSYTGLAKNENGWFYVKDGKVDFSYTGLCKYGNAWYYVQEGMLNWNYSGLTLYGGSWYYVEKGVLNWNYTGLCQYQGSWYYVQKGVLNWKYTGLVRHTNGVSYYVQNGKINFSYISGS